VNKRVFDEQIQQMNLEQTVLQKIKFQWKTLKKAFSDLNQEKSGAIKPIELRHYLNNWGLFVTEDQFKKIFSHFDQDGDGKISYEDF
jgi:Ca2+-binding EF-hand superfamily protein